MKRLLIAAAMVLAVTTTPATVYTVEHLPILPVDADPPIINPNADGHYACDSMADCNQWAGATCGQYSQYIVIYTTDGSGNGIGCTAMCRLPGWPSVVFSSIQANCG